MRFRAHGVHATARFTPTIRMVTVAAVLVVTLTSVWLTRHAWGFRSNAQATTDSPAVTAVRADAAHGDAAHGANGKPATPSGAGQVLSAGPISELDKQLLIKVRQADLWEMPAGRLAQTNGLSEPVRRAGLHLIDGHSRLDQMVREISVALNLPIPDQASAEQQGWVRQLQANKGAAFDRLFANLLRNSHGKVFVVIAQVRATTQNSVIRDLAIEANTTVADHMQVLEDTGLVDPATFDDVTKAVVR